MTRRRWFRCRRGSSRSSGSSERLDWSAPSCRFHCELRQVVCECVDLAISRRGRGSSSASSSCRCRVEWASRGERTRLCRRWRRSTRRHACSVGSLRRCRECWRSAGSATPFTQRDAPSNSAEPTRIRRSPPPPLTRSYSVLRGSSSGCAVCLACCQCARLLHGAVLAIQSPHLDLDQLAQQAPLTSPTRVRYSCYCGRA